MSVLVRKSALGKFHRIGTDKRACDRSWRSNVDEPSAPRTCAAGGPDTGFGGAVVLTMLMPLSLLALPPRGGTSSATKEGYQLHIFWGRRVLAN
jgi:hypothetical protein